jgi:hypothetical protein
MRQFIKTSYSFTQHSGDGPKVIETSVTMPAPVSQAGATLTGFITESKRGGEDLCQMDVQVQVSGPPQGAIVPVSIKCRPLNRSHSSDEECEVLVFFSITGE